MRNLLLITLLLLPFTSHSALVGRLVDSEGNYQAYYDTEADLTWLADANYAQTSGYDADGLMSLVESMAWAESINIGSIDGWRLARPQTELCGACTGNEMGNLIFNVLGGGWGIATSITEVHNSNYDLFKNVYYNFYWLSTESPHNFREPVFHTTYGQGGWA